MHPTPSHALHFTCHVSFAESRLDRIESRNEVYAFFRDCAGARFLYEFHALPFGDVQSDHEAESDHGKSLGHTVVERKTLGGVR